MRTPAEQERFLTEERFQLAKPYTFPAWLELYSYKSEMKSKVA
jgi:hypothetical protein